MMNLEQCNNAKKFLFWIITNTCTVIVMLFFPYIMGPKFNWSRIQFFHDFTRFFSCFHYLYTNIAVNKHSQYLNTNIELLAWPHWWSFEALFEGQWKSNHKDIFLELIYVQKIYSQLTLVLKIRPMRSR